MNALRIIKDSCFSYLAKNLGLNIQVRNLNFAVTYRCNSRCLSCGIWKTDEKNAVKDELSVKKIKKIFSQFKNLEMISLTGGEPFLRKDILDIVKSIKADNINISTNGLLQERIIESCEEIVKLPFKSAGISVSIDAIGNKNDQLRGVKGAYKKSIETIKGLKEIGKKNKKLVIGISNTISKGNIEDVLEVYGLSKKLNVVFSTRLAQTSDLFYKNVSSKIFVDKEDIIKVKNVFEFLLKKQPRNLFYRYCLNKFLNNPNKQPVPCFSGFNSFFLDPYGNLYPCIMLNNRVGNLREKSLKSLLNSTKAKGIREYIRKGKCSCWTECEAINSIYSNPKELLKAFICSI